jgi:hypothetical protein
VSLKNYQQSDHTNLCHLGQAVADVSIISPEN